MKRKFTSKGIMILAAASMAALVAPTATAGDVYLTGHDTLLHGGQAGYDAIILDYLRGSTAKADYNIGVVGTSSTGSAYFTDNSTYIPGVAHGGAIALSGTLSGYGSATFYNAASMDGSEFAGLDGLVVLSHTSCGGCSLTDAGSAALNALSAQIATAFNAGMDIWGNAGGELTTYYDFLPPGAVATAHGITPSSGFSATAAGAALGIVSGNINGYQTHSRFSDFSPAFTVFETHSNTDEEGQPWKISLGLKDGSISDDGIIITDDGTPPAPGVPDNGATLLLLGLALPCLAGIRRLIRR